MNSHKKDLSSLKESIIISVPSSGQPSYNTSDISEHEDGDEFFEKGSAATITHQSILGVNIETDNV